MRKFIILLVICFTALTANAQNIPYQKTDSISDVISKTQVLAEGLSYNDGENDYVLSFPEQNFTILFSTGKAQKAVYKWKDGMEYFYLTEGIDLSKASKLHKVNFRGLAGVIRMVFPEGVQTKIYTNGQYTKTVTEYYLEFFYPRNVDRLQFPGTDLRASLGGMGAFYKLENKLPFEEFQYQSATKLNSKYGPDAAAKYDLYLNNTIKKASELRRLTFNTNTTEYDRQHADEFASYQEQAVKLMPHLLISGGNSFMDRRLYYYNLGGNFEKMDEMLNSPNIFYTDIPEEDILKYKAEYLLGKSQCREAEKLLLDTYNSPYSSTRMKYAAGMELKFLYSNGCKGEGDNKVKKDKKLRDFYDAATYYGY